MRARKDFKYYFRFYLMVVLVYAIYVSILAIRDGGYETYMLLSVLYLPPLFVGFLFIIDRLLDPVFGLFRGNKQKNEDKYQVFITQATQSVQQTLSLSLEDIHALRRNDRFQKGLDQAFRIQTEGETDSLNFIVLEKKFKKGTKEYDAFQEVIKTVKKNLENQ